MVQLLFGHNQVVIKDRWSLNVGGHEDMFHCTILIRTYI